MGYKQSPKLGFCFTGQVLIKSAILKPGLLSLGCGWLVIAKAIATFTIVFQNEANLNLPFRKNFFFFYTGAGGSRRGPKAVTVTGWLPKPHLRRRNTSLPRGASSGGGGWSSGLTLESGFNSTGTDTCSQAFLRLKGSNCL